MSLIDQYLDAETRRQRDTLNVCAAENYMSARVRKALAHPIGNKTAEGYPGKRFHSGCQVLDKIEEYAKDLACKAFDAEYANVQPHCASNANYAVIYTVCNPGDRILSMKLDHGGHLSHGAPVSIIGKSFEIFSYGVHAETELLDYDETERVAREIRPKLIICGSSSYSRAIDFARFGKIAEETGAYLLADISHFAGLIVGGAYPNPVQIANFTTLSTYKTFRGPRGGIILMGKGSRNECTPNRTFAQGIDGMIFPGIQSAIHTEHVAAKAVALEESLTDEFRQYARNVVACARRLADRFTEAGFHVVSGGTDSHLVILNLEKAGMSGFVAEKALESFNISINKNLIPNDKRSPFVTSGIRLGTAPLVSRGFGIEDMTTIADIIVTVLRSITVIDDKNFQISTKARAEIARKVETLISEHPLA